VQVHRYNQVVVRKPEKMPGLDGIEKLQRCCYEKEIHGGILDEAWWIGCSLGRGRGQFGAGSFYSILTTNAH